VPSFEPKPESPAEIEAEQALDNATRDVGWDEFEKEGERERTLWAHGFLGSLTFFGRFRRRERFRRVAGDPVPEPIDDHDPGDEHGLRAALDEQPSAD
jgi:hypothetical protein